MQCIDRDSAAQLIDFSGGATELQDLGSQQLDGAVALHNMLARQGVAYLADEVGMGKTYIALGVVALMRRMKPGLRVLYLLPKNNVRDKWRKDYHSFVQANYKVCDLRVKGLDGQPAAHHTVCRSLYDFIQSVATGSAREFFICSSAFSLPLGNTAAELEKSIDHFCALLPQAQEPVEALRRKLENTAPEKKGTLDALKEELKQLWAGTLNAILPQFDLVVVDEAHNFRRGCDTSARNKLVTTVLGAGANSKAKRLLFLSATPFDRDINHLRNQLALFGKPDAVMLDKKTTREEREAALAAIMIRRLNTIDIGGQPHTRNMYRDEHRSGPRAEVTLRLEQQLFAALLQKKVNEHLQENCQGRFELGMLASFESYLPGTRNKPVEFDGVDDAAPVEDGDKRDAQDRGIVEWLTSDYHQQFRRPPPHPKMDSIAAEAHRQSMDLGKKQLIFVRRVRSVAELSFNIEYAYDTWLGNYIADDEAVRRWWNHYRANRRQEYAWADEAVDDTQATTGGSNFFSWFYRGTNPELEKAGDLGTLPHNFRAMLAISSLFEFNWSTLPGMPAPAAIAIDWPAAVPRTRATVTPQSRFEQAQYAYLNAVASQGDAPTALAARRILEYAFPHFESGIDLADPRQLAHELTRPTLWDHCATASSLAPLAPGHGQDVMHTLAESDTRSAERCVRRLLIQQKLIAVLCRLDHPFIDLYALRGSRNAHRDDTGESADERLAGAFARLLEQQAQAGAAFCTYRILRDVAGNLDLLIKLNFEDAYKTSAGELVRYLSTQLAPLTPVNGATGRNSKHRSLIARRFRMPGYPRVLVSTDVFQEGEDLHTFCDQVVHYGIPASPIALEQKVGRVDRVASLAHRNLGANSVQPASHFIQVFYPHIRESLEFLQVRQASHNLNQFQRSLHRLGEAPQQFASQVDIGQQLQDKSAIPEQIRNRLETPYPVRPADLDGQDRQAQFNQEQDNLGHRLDHIRERIEACVGALAAASVTLTGNSDGLAWQGGVHEVAVQVGSVAGLPDLVLTVRAVRPVHDQQDIPVSAATIKTGDCFSNLQQLQQDPGVRLRLVHKEGDTLLLREAQIYAGTRRILVDDEIRDTYYRAVPGADTAPIPPAHADCDLGQILAAQVRLEGPYTVARIGHAGLRFHFKQEGRIQDVCASVHGRHLLVTSLVLDASALDAYRKQAAFLISLTVERNARFNVIDFHIDQQGGLAVRAMHPLAHLNPQELEFVALMVASEADRLQHLLTCGADDEGEDDEDDAGINDDNGTDDAAADNGRPIRIALDDTARIMYTIRNVLQQRALPRPQLIRETARQLGYERTGRNIATALDGHVRKAVRRGIAVHQNGTISLLARSIDGYERSFLKTQFLAALSAHSSGFVDREEAIVAWARWMGFNRTGHVIRDHARSMINGLLREQRLEARGQQIRRSR